MIISLFILLILPININQALLMEVDGSASCGVVFMLGRLEPDTGMIGDS